MHSINITFWNVEGFDNLFKLNQKEKDQFFQSEIICLAETWKLDEIILQGDLMKYQIIQQVAVRTGSRGRGIGGLIMMINRKAFEILWHRKSSNFIFAKIRTNYNKEEILIACMYIQPCDPDGRMDECLDIFLRWADSTSNQKVILIGDFNARIGDNDICTPDLPATCIVQNKRQARDGITNTQGRRLIECLDEANLTVLNGRTCGDINGEYTFSSTNGASSIDLCFINDVCISQLQSFQVGSMHVSSHSPISLQLGIPQVKCNKNISMIRWKKHKEDVFREQLNTSNSTTIDQFNSALITAAIKSNMIVKNNRKASSPWYDKECYSKWREARNALRLSRAAGSPQHLVQHYHSQRIQYKSLIRLKKEGYTNGQREKVNATKTPSEFWNAIKDFRKRPAAYNPIPEADWKSFYDNISPTERQTTQPFQGTYDAELDCEIKIDELMYALRKAKNGKASGPDGIPNELYKNLTESGKRDLLEVMNNIFSSEAVPKEWGESTTVMVYKKGDTADPINYRPISLLNVSMKLFMHIITNRISRWAANKQILPEEQAGFRANRGCDEQIFNLNAAIQLGTRNKKKVFALFIDFKRAFPSLPHVQLWTKLYQIGVSAKIIRILQTLYSEASTKIRLSEGFSNNIPITEGVLQGCVASPLLFTLYISDVIEIIKASGISGVPIGDQFTLHMLLFADDMVLLASTPRALQLKINVIMRYFEGLGLHINITKTKIVIFQRGGQRSSPQVFKYGESNIEIVKEYQYLGVIFSNSCVFRKAAEFAKRKGLKAVGSMWKLFCQGRINRWETQKLLFNSLVTSTVLYSGHVWAWQYSDILEKVQSRFIRRLFHLGFKTPTYVMRLETNSTKIQHTLGKLIINFVIRILSMENSRIAKICYVELFKTADADPKRYNWVTSLRDFLRSVDSEDLGHSVDPLEWFYKKENIIDKLGATLKQYDIDKALSSNSHRYAAELESGKRIVDYMSLGLRRTRILAQMRMNQTHFFWNNTSHELHYEDKCPHCNLTTNEDLFHFLVECRIHRSSQQRFLNPLQQNPEVTRDNLLQRVLHLPLPDLKNLSSYCITSLCRRKLLIDLSSY
jgi:exonuclease III